MKVTTYRENTIKNYLHWVLRDKKAANPIINFFQRTYNLTAADDIRTLIQKLQEHPELVYDKLRNYSQDKAEVKNRLAYLLQRLALDFQLDWDQETYFGTGLYLDGDRRLLEMLKYLHSGAKTREEIANHFNISEKSLSDDLKVLQDDYSFMGQNMKITLKRGDNTYESTIHPIFLPLNLTEIFALTIAIKTLVDESNLLKDHLHNISDRIFQQLSPYASEKILRDAEKYNITFNHVPTCYNPESNYTSHERKERLNENLIHFIKLGEPREVRFIHEGHEISKIGIPKFSPTTDSWERISLIEFDNTLTEISIDQIIDIS